jgi:hypothetical protein
MSFRIHRLDWVQALVLGIFVPAFLETLSPYEREVSLTDSSVSYPRLPDIVPAWAVLLLAFAVPSSVFFIIEVCKWSRSVSVTAPIFALGLIEANGLYVVASIPSRSYAIRCYVCDLSNVLDTKSTDISTFIPAQNSSRHQCFEATCRSSTAELCVSVSGLRGWFDHSMCR